LIRDTYAAHRSRRRYWRAYKKAYGHPSGSPPATPGLPSRHPIFYNLKSG